jgi:CBS domain containing-hemolysin-like protein
MSRALGAHGHSRGGHSGEELKFIVASSRAEGHLSPFEEEAIEKLIDLNQYVAREIMTPRNQIVSLPIHADLDHVLKVMGEHLFSRLPVYEGSPEHIVGVVHYRDLLSVWQQRRRSTERRRSVPPFQLNDWIRKPLVIPETKPLNQLIDEFRTNHQHLAIVVDEFGTIAGIVTMEDVLEQVFGEIEDEHDQRRLQPQPEAEEIEVEGTIPLRDLETQYDLVLPAEDEYETLAGFLLFKLGYIPRPGETVEAEGRLFTITGMERNRIAQVRIERRA